MAVMIYVIVFLIAESNVSKDPAPDHRNRLSANVRWRDTHKRYWTIEGS